MLPSTVKEIILPSSPWPSVLGAYGKMEFWAQRIPGKKRVWKQKERKSNPFHSTWTCGEGKGNCPPSPSLQSTGVLVREPDEALLGHLCNSRVFGFQSAWFLCHRQRDSSSSLALMGILSTLIYFQPSKLFSNLLFCSEITPLLKTCFELKDREVTLLNLSLMLWGSLSCVDGQSVWGCDGNTWVLYLESGKAVRALR